MKEILAILKYKLIGLNLLLVILSGATMFISIYFVPVFFILISNLYDILGYHFTLIRRSKIMPEKVIIRSYRVTQLMFDLTLLILTAVLFNPFVSFSSAVLKVFGVQDILYYVFLRMELPEKWTWLKWTPLGMIFKTLSKTQVIIQCLFGIFLAVLILIYL